MAKFRYTAADPTGKLVRGTLDADSRVAIVERLQGQGQIPLRVEPANRPGALLDVLNVELAARRGLSKREVADLTREMAVMLGAGQDLDRALRFVVEITPGRRAQEILQDVRDKVRGGSALAAALAVHASSFSRLYIGMVRAGEAGGTLAETLDRLAGLLERERRMAAGVQSAMVYPVLLVVAAVSVILLLLVDVLPQFTPIFEQAGAALPGPTRVLIALGDVARRDGLWIVITFLLVGHGAQRLLRLPGPGARLHRALLFVPLVGELIRQTQAAHLTRTLGTLLKNGVGLLATLSIAREVLGNLAAIDAVAGAEASAKEGGSLSRPLEAAGVFPIRTIYLLRLGEETGRLGDMALRAADIHDEHVRLGLQRLTSLIVPMATIVTGLAVAGIIASLVAAMLSINDLAL